MTDVLKITVNTEEVRLALRSVGGTGIHRVEMLRIIGQHMVGSVMKTFRDQGVPANSWAPLKEWTQVGAKNRIGFRKGILTGRKGGKGQLRAGKQILIESSRLRNSVAWEQDGNAVMIGSNLVYAAIHQLGGFAGRRSPKGRSRYLRGKEGPFRRPFIPARPYLVFRPEDPAAMEGELDTFIAAKYREAGFETFDGRGTS